MIAPDEEISIEVIPVVEAPVIVEAPKVKVRPVLKYRSPPPKRRPRRQRDNEEELRVVLLKDLGRKFKPEVIVGYSTELLLALHKSHLDTKIKSNADLSQWGY